jgi:hypothetical protein
MMSRRTLWKKIPVNSIDRRSYGRTAKAYRHPNGGLLLMHRPRSRNARGHLRINVWAVVLNDTLVRRRTTYGRRVTAPPIPWANRMLRRFNSGDSMARHASDGTRPTVRRSIESTPPRYDELPPSLVQPSRRAGATDAPADVPVPTRLPMVPLSRTINGTFAQAVLSQEEFDLFLEMWRAWTADHPEYAQPMNRVHLITICLESVLMFRLQLLGHVPSPRLAKMYHASHNRQQRVREALGGTRRQRLEAGFW